MTTTAEKEHVTLEERVEAMKKSFDIASEKSKQAIKEILSTCNEQAKKAVDTNQQIIGSAIKQLEAFKVDTSYFRQFYNTIGKSVELSEEVIDSIIESHNKRVNLTVDFNKKCLESLKEQTLYGGATNEKLLKVLQDNFNDSIQLSINNMKGIINMYNKHLNLSTNFSKNFNESIDKQVEFMADIYRKQVGMFTDWTANWWEKDGGSASSK